MPDINANDLVTNFGKKALVKALLSQEEVNVGGKSYKPAEIITDTDLLEQYQDGKVCAFLKEKHNINDPAMGKSVIRILRDRDPDHCNEYDERGEVIMQDSECFVDRGGTYPKSETSPGDRFNPKGLPPGDILAPSLRDDGEEISSGPGAAVKNLASARSGQATGKA